MHLLARATHDPWRIEAIRESIALHVADLEPAEKIGRTAGERAVKRLNPRKVTTRRVPVVYDHRVASSLIGHLSSAINGSALVSGVTQNYPDTLRPALQVIGVREGIHKVSGIYLLITRKGDLFFLADATVNIEPTAEDLAEIALCAAQEARRFDVEPRVAMLSFSTFGSTRHPLCDKVRRAVESGEASEQASASDLINEAFQDTTTASAAACAAPSSAARTR